MTALTTRLSRSARPTPKRRVSAPCRATIGHTASASTMKKSGYACGPALTRKMAWVALKAVYNTQVADLADPVSDLPRLGWLGGLVVRGDDSGPTTVTATHFEERDLTF